MHNIQTVGTQYLFVDLLQLTKKKNETVYSYAICLFFIMIFQVCAYSMRALCFE